MANRRTALIVFVVVLAIALIAATITTLENVPTRAFSNETPPYDRAGSAQPPSDLAPGAPRVSSGNVVAKALTPRPSVFRIG